MEAKDQEQDPEDDTIPVTDSEEREAAALGARALPRGGRVPFVLHGHGIRGEALHLPQELRVAQLRVRQRVVVVGAGAHSLVRAARPQLAPRRRWRE